LQAPDRHQASTKAALAVAANIWGRLTVPSALAPAGLTRQNTVDTTKAMSSTWLVRMMEKILLRCCRITMRRKLVRNMWEQV
jgi:hypothetical protein